MEFSLNKLANSSLSRSAILVLIHLKTIKTWTGTQSELADTLSIDRRTINEALKNLTNLGYIKKIKQKNGDSRLRKLVFKEVQNG